MGKWQRFKYLPVKPLGEDGRTVTGCQEHIRLSRKAAAEGMVLLKNENGLLPLKAGSRVALFGKASADYVKGGGGSGDVTAAYVRNLCDGMEEKAGGRKGNHFPAAPCILPGECGRAASGGQGSGPHRGAGAAGGSGGPGRVGL